MLQRTSDSPESVAVGLSGGGGRSGMAKLMGAPKSGMLALCLSGDSIGEFDNEFCPEE
jgi:hypothetical protein